MAKLSIFPKSNNLASPDPFSKKGALTLFYLLAEYGKDKRDAHFAINEVSRLLGVSPGTVHRVVLALEAEGIIKSQGLRTNKRFTLSDPKELLVRWSNHYSITKKAKSRQFAISDPAQFNKALATLQSSGKLVPALHTAARETFHAGVTNLRTREFYAPSWQALGSYSKSLSLVEQDRGYEVLLIQPYYKEVVLRFIEGEALWASAMAILTFLDLFHYPLRGREQAESLFRKTRALSRLCSWSDFECSLG